MAVVLKQSDHFGEAQQAVAEQLCEAELEAQNWRLRCFQAEAQLRLQRLKRRGEQHARWPKTATERQQLLGTRASQQGLDVQSIKQALGGLVQAKATLGCLEEQLQQTSEEVERCCKETLQQHDLASMQASEDASFAQRELELTQGKERVQEMAKQLQQSFVLENELAEQVALGQDELELVQRQLQAFLPTQQQMEREAVQAQQEADRFRQMALRRREAVGKVEEEVDSLEKGALEEQAALQQRLEQMRAELTETQANTTELGEQTRKAHLSHSRQIKAVKDGGSALRDALSEVGQGKEDLQADLERLREIVADAGQVHAERLRHAEEAQQTNQALEEEVQMARDSLKLAEVAHEEAAGNRAEAVKAGLSNAKERLSQAQEAARSASQSTTEAAQQLEALQGEKKRLLGETGPAAASRRAQAAEALRKELGQLQVEVQSMEEQCSATRERMEWHRHLREAQQFARTAAKEAAACIRGVYSDMAKPGPLQAAPGRAARRLSKHLEDFARFLAEAVALAEEKDAKQKASVNLNLPSALKEAYVGKLINEDGHGPGQLDSARDKLKALRSELQEADANHRSERTRLATSCEHMQQRIAEGEGEAEVELRKSQEAQQKLSEGITEAGCERNKAQMQAVARVQRELAAHEQDMALLRQERDRLKAQLATAEEPAGDVQKRGEGNVSARLQQRELELQDLRRRLKAGRERYVALVQDAGGKDAVEELGLPMPRSTSPRPLTRPSAQLTPPPMRSTGETSPAVAGRDSSAQEAAAGANVDKSDVDVKPEKLDTRGDARSEKSLEADGKELSKGVEGWLPSPVEATAACTSFPPEPRAEPSAPGPTPTPGSQATSTPWGEMEVAPLEPSPKSCSELASPSVLPKALAEQRQRDAEAFSPSQEEPLLRLEPAPVLASETREPASVPGPALAISWAEIEAAALEPTPKCSDVASPSARSSPLEEPVAQAEPVAVVACQASARDDAPRQQEVRSGQPVPYWEPMSRTRSPSPYGAGGSPVVHVPVLVPVLQQVPVTQQGTPVVPGTPVIQQTTPVQVQVPLVRHSDGRMRSPGGSPLPMYRMSQVVRSRSPSPEVPAGMRWGVIGTEALSPLARTRAQEASKPHQERRWVDDPMVSLREGSHISAASPVSAVSAVSAVSGTATSAVSSSLDSHLSPCSRLQAASPQESSPRVPQERSPRLPKRRPSAANPAASQPRKSEVEFGSSEWATRALEGEQMLLPEPQLPPLEVEDRSCGGTSRGNCAASSSKDAEPAGKNAEDTGQPLSEVGW
ncbi:unnamed protein product [Effrenium voratum]|nr:unnamed protein product [Effrenium voratum]